MGNYGLTGTGSLTFINIVLHKKIKLFLNKIKNIVYTFRYLPFGSLTREKEYDKRYKYYKIYRDRRLAPYSRDTRYIKFGLLSC